MAETMRIDKWLWTMRLFKTRSIAADACKTGRVFRGGVTQKPSNLVRVGDVIGVKRQSVLFSFKILKFAPNRLGAKLVPEFIEQVTTEDQLQLWEMIRLDRQNARAKGLGRPTKKERRDLDSFFDDTPFFLDDDWDDGDED